MNSKPHSSFSLALCATLILSPVGLASVRPDSWSAKYQVIVLKLSDLRSAYLLRAGVMQYDPSQMSPTGIRAQLQRHFDTVLGLLLVSTPRSIETALDRLEAASGQCWSNDERATWRQRLLTNRYLQMRRLAIYRDLGLFPQNEGHADHAVPIFVDLHDTACAVGHLMRLSGWQEVVAEIQQSNNFVFVPDAASSVAARWALKSGLTLEEAALIQPGYPFIVDNSMAPYGPGGSALIRDGLQYENFQVILQNFVNPDINLPQSLCKANPEACAGTPTTGGPVLPTPDIGLRLGVGTYFEPSTLTHLDPVGTHWIGIGGVSMNLMPHLIGGRAQTGFGQQITIRFDVSTVMPGMVINQVTQHNDPLEGGFSPFHIFPPPPVDNSNYFMVTRILTDQGVVASTLVDRNTPFVDILSQSGGEQISTADFQPLNRATVETDLWLINGIGVDSIALDFNVERVPEPASIAILFAGLTLIGCITQRSRGLNTE